MESGRHYSPLAIFDLLQEQHPDQYVIWEDGNLFYQLFDTLEDLRAAFPRAKGKVVVRAERDYILLDANTIDQDEETDSHERYESVYLVNNPDTKALFVEEG